MIDLAVIGRSLRSPKWNTLFEILEQGAEEKYWSYSTFDVDKFDKKSFDGRKFDHHILVGTKALDETTPNIRFYATATEEEIIEKMQAFADSIFGDEDGSVTSDSIHSAPSGDEAPWLDSESVCVSNDVLDNGSVHDSASTSSDTDNDSVSSNEQRFDSLVGLQVEVGGKDLFLSYHDALQLKEMLAIMKEYGYSVKNVIVSGAGDED